MTTIYFQTRHLKGYIWQVSFHEAEIVFIANTNFVTVLRFMDDRSYFFPKPMRSAFAQQTILNLYFKVSHFNSSDKFLLYKITVIRVIIIHLQL